jgi:hypothetical protein
VTTDREINPPFPGNVRRPGTASASGLVRALWGCGLTVPQTPRIRQISRQRDHPPDGSGFLYDLFQGRAAAPGRRPWPFPCRIAWRCGTSWCGARVAARSCGEVAGLLGDSGAAACPRPMGGSPPVAGAAAAPMPRTRRQAAPAATFPQRRASTKWPGRPPVAGQSLTAKDHRSRARLAARR